MLRLGHVLARNCQGVTRRELLQVGGASLLGLSLADVLAADTPAAASRDTSCIFIYLAGGPSQFETFDPKPEAQSRIRGPWGAIGSALPGVWFGEMLPELARQADRFSLVRSLHHTQALHHPWPMLTGTMTHRVAHGSAVTHLRGRTATDMPPYVHLGAKLSVDAGVLGAAAEPLAVRHPIAAAEALGPFVLAPDISPGRLAGRGDLLRQVDRVRAACDQAAEAHARDGLFQQALSILASGRVRAAFDLAQESSRLRDRYGANCFGQSCLLARRLIEAGTRYVQLAWYDREDGFGVGWDVHGDDQNGLVRMEQQLCPRLDQGLSALLADLDNRGLLDSTLVCAVGEFGRTPHISRHGGRDHWPFCFSALLAGGGAPRGHVVGASDARGAFPADRPVGAADFAATLYRLLGVDPNRDDRLRPSVFEGHAVEELLAG